MRHFTWTDVSVLDKPWGKGIELVRASEQDPSLVLVVMEDSRYTSFIAAVAAEKAGQ
jgi:hypothetical protein